MGPSATRPGWRLATCIWPEAAGIAASPSVPGGSAFDDPVAHGASGGPGDDELWGFEVDYLFGGDGDDTLVMHNGGRARGGPGADTFRFFGSEVEARIDDFSPAEGDVIELSSVGFGGVTKSDVQAMLDGSSGNVLDLGLLGVADRDYGTITLDGIQVSDLGVNELHHRVRRGSMTETELVEALRRMREYGRQDQRVSEMTILFGIVFNAELEELGRGASDSVAKAYNERNYYGKMNGTAIRDGMNLARYVEPHPSVARRWRRG